MGHRHPLCLGAAWWCRLPGLGEESLSALKTFGLTRIYGKTRALAGLDLDVPEGAVYGLVGPNGSGKTTALEIVAGLRRPTEGEVQLGVALESLAYCPDAAEFEPWLTAMEVLEAATGLLGHQRSRSDLREMIERVGLADSANRRVGGFSRGMRSRLGLAAALIGEPGLLLADEPAAALDPAGRVEILALLAELAGPVTVVVSSHDLGDVERICTSIGVLAHGRLAYQGSVKELLAKAPTSWRVVVRPPAAPLLAALSTAPWVRSVREGPDGELTVDVADPMAAELELPRVLAQCRAALVEVGRTRVSLQDIFFELTETGPARSKAGF